MSHCERCPEDAVVYRPSFSDALCEVHVLAKFDTQATQLAALECERASLCDFLNSWARECQIPEAERPEEIKALVDRLWVRFAALEVEVERLKFCSNCHDLSLMRQEAIIRAEQAEAEVERVKDTQVFNDGLDDSVIRKLRQKIAQAEAERDAATKAWYAASDLVGKVRTELAPFVALAEQMNREHDTHHGTYLGLSCAGCDALAHPDVQRAMKEEE